jgi:Amt family ammonium transporter
MVGGALVAFVTGKYDPGFVRRGALAGLVAVCAKSDLMHPQGALITGRLFVTMFTLTQNR